MLEFPEHPTTPAQTHLPLSEQLRPKDLALFVGQDDLFKQNGPLHFLTQESTIRPPNLIFWGPPGCGKTTLAQLIGQKMGTSFVQLSAVFSGVAELKKLFAKAQQDGQPLTLFIDEIHRFNKAQQDALLGPIEQGWVHFLAATTENPSFHVNSALLSRVRVIPLQPLRKSALHTIAQRAIQHNAPLSLTESALDLLLDMADGDARFLLNTLQDIPPHPTPLDAPQLLEHLHQKPRSHDRAGDAHYNLISALIKSMRGSDPQAALYWFYTILQGGEDPLYVARRMIRFAGEDIGLADPQALMHATATYQAYEKLGSPEGDLILANTVVYLATAPKSNACYVAAKAAAHYVKTQGTHTPPPHILNAPTKLMKDMGYGHGYRYDHDEPDAFSGQDYFPETLTSRVFYQPVPRGFERDIIKRLAYWNTLRQQRKESKS